MVFFTSLKLTGKQDPPLIPGDVDTSFHRLDQRFGYGESDPIAAFVCVLSGCSLASARRYRMRLVLSVKPFKKAGIIHVCAFRIIV